MFFFDIGDRNWLIHGWFFHCHVSFRGCRRVYKGWSGWLRYGFWYFICKCFFLLYIHGQSLGMTQMVISILCLLLVCGILRKIAKLISSHDYFQVGWNQIYTKQYSLEYAWLDIIRVPVCYPSFAIWTQGLSPLFQKNKREGFLSTN